MYKALVVIAAIVLLATPALAGLEDTATPSASTLSVNEPNYGSGSIGEAIDDNPSTYYQSAWGGWGDPSLVFPHAFVLTWDAPVTVSQLDFIWKGTPPTAYTPLTAFEVYADPTSITWPALPVDGPATLVGGTLIGTGGSPHGGLNTYSLAVTPTSLTQLVLMMNVPQNGTYGDYAIAEIEVTPEPATMALMGLGVVGMLIRRKRR